MRKRPGERQKPWLLIKSDDEAARGPDDPDILEEKPRSVVSRPHHRGDREGRGRGLALEPIGRREREADQDGEEDQEGTPRRKPKRKKKAKSRAALAVADVLRDQPARARRSALPDFVPPQLATLQRQARRTAPDWVHEVKFDGYRIQARLDHGKVRLLTRKALDWTAKFQRVADAVAQARRRRAR